LHCDGELGKIVEVLEDWWTVNSAGSSRIPHAFGSDLPELGCVNVGERLGALKAA
jgi:hypothetical protein